VFVVLINSFYTAYTYTEMVVISQLGKIAEKAVCRSVLLTTWRSIMSAEHSCRLLFGYFAHLTWFDLVETDVCNFNFRRFPTFSTFSKT